MLHAEPQMGGRDLAPHPHRIELTGHPRDLAWPALCPRCGAPAHERIAVAKVFVRRHERARENYLVTTARIPFCDGCAALHRQQAASLSPARRALTYVASPMVIAVLGAAIAAVGVFRAVGGASLADPAARIPLLLAVGLAAVAVAGALALVWSTRRLRVPPQTEVTRACDFSDAIGSLLTGSYRVYAIRDRGFAEALAALNRGRAWTAADHARSRRIAAVALVVGLLVIAGTSILVSR